ncbi:hypothetical protein [Propionimicrobium lymphophilum]|uniref:hypothetical protein n=1 Tax=Propionimicrobium lymphophilum TaxID=33012 RepID=UPI00254EDFAF|nr:hypothetical protein [Propionimicrobium lymphophilum]MDK7710390.1 hypothetical protein [Propionimicrobium lymphophilum]
MAGRTWSVVGLEAQGRLLSWLLKAGCCSGSLRSAAGLDWVGLFMVTPIASCRLWNSGLCVTGNVSPLLTKRKMHLVPSLPPRLDVPSKTRTPTTSAK